MNKQYNIPQIQLASKIACIASDHQLLRSLQQDIEPDDELDELSVELLATLAEDPFAIAAICRDYVEMIQIESSKG